MNLAFWLILGGALAGLVHRHIRRNVVVALVVIAGTALLSVWGAAFQTFSFQARYALFGLPAIAGLAALGLETWKLPVRFVLPVM